MGTKAKPVAIKVVTTEKAKGAKPKAKPKSKPLGPLYVAYREDDEIGSDAIALVAESMLKLREKIEEDLESAEEGREYQYIVYVREGAVFAKTQVSTVIKGMEGYT